MSTQPSLATFRRTTFLWGNITLGAGLIVATFLPFYLIFFADVAVSWGQILTAFAAVAAIFGVFWIIEPLSYYPVLGPAGMYQAFMVGNISNKLLPAAIVAQNAIGAKPGTHKASFAATAAICGAALMHVLSLFMLVGLFGTWLHSHIPAEVTSVARLYILPSILGGVGVQLVCSAKQGRTTLIALGSAAFVVFGLAAWVPATKSASVGIVVFATMILAWVLRERDKKQPGAGGASEAPAERELEPVTQ